MYKKVLFILLGVLLGGTLTAQAVSVFITGQGGTGTTTPSGILSGDNGATTHLNTVRIGSNLTYSGGTLSATGGSPGSPANSVQYNNAGSFGGSSTFLFDGLNTVTFGTEDIQGTLKGPNASTPDTTGGGLSIQGGDGLGSGNGGIIDITGSTGGSTGEGGSVSINGGNGGAISGDGGTVNISSGNGEGVGNSGDIEIFVGSGGSTSGSGGNLQLVAGNGGLNGNGGDVQIQAGTKDGAGTDGHIYFQDPTSGTHGIFNTSSLSGPNKTFTFPNQSGTLCLTTTCAGSAFPFTPTTNYGATANSTTTPIWFRLGLQASSTAYLDQISVGSTTAGLLSTSTFFGNLSVRGAASTTDLYISSISSGSLLKTTTAGKVIAAVAGTDYINSSGLASAYPFQVIGNATSTLTQFNGGITAYATSTIGNSTEGGGLTVSGSATTTGNAYFLSNVGVGSTTPWATLSVNAAAGVNSFAIGSSSGTTLLVNPAGNVSIGTTSSIGKLNIASPGSSNQLVIMRNDTGDKWGFGVGGAGNLVFGYNNSLTGNILNADIKSIFTTTGNFQLGTSTAPYSRLAVWGAGTAGNQLVEFANNASTTLFKLQENGTLFLTGNVGIGTTSPWGKFSIVGTTDPLFVVATSTGNSIGGYDADGHVFTSGPAPTISSCGTGTGTVVGDDQSGTITTATAATACTATFSKPYKNTPTCSITDDSTVGFASISAISTTAVTFGISSALTAGKLYYRCTYHR